MPVDIIKLTKTKGGEFFYPYTHVNAVNGLSETLSGYVTLTGSSQSISSAKTFTSLLTASSGIRTSSIAQSSGHDLEIGNESTSDFLHLLNPVWGLTYTDDDDDEVPYWSIGATGNAMFSSLNVTGSASVGNGMTIAGTTTVSGHFIASTDATYSLGYSGSRWSAINGKSIGVNRLYFAKDDNTGTNYADITASHDDNSHVSALFLTLGYPSSGTFVTNKTYIFNDTYGFFAQNGGVVLGRDDHRWSNVYSVGGNFSGNIMPASDNESHIGQPGTRFASGNFCTGAFSTFELRDYATGSIRRAAFSTDNNLLAVQLYSLASGASTPVNSGTFYINGGLNSIYWQGNSGDGFPEKMYMGHPNAKWARVYTERLYLDEHTYLYNNSGNWHITTDNNGSVNLIVDGDISCTA